MQRRSSHGPLKHCMILKLIIWGGHLQSRCGNRMFTKKLRMDKLADDLWVEVETSHR